MALYGQAGLKADYYLALPPALFCIVLSAPNDQIRLSLLEKFIAISSHWPHTRIPCWADNNQNQGGFGYAGWSYLPFGLSLLSALQVLLMKSEQQCFQRRTIHDIRIWRFYAPMGRRWLRFWHLVAGETGRLRLVFTQVYNFSMQSWLILRGNTHRAMLSKAVDFVMQNGSEECLFTKISTCDRFCDHAWRDPRNDSRVLL
jgi:hypothetical protein